MYVINKRIFFYIYSRKFGIYTDILMPFDVTLACNMSSHSLWWSTKNMSCHLVVNYFFTGVTIFPTVPPKKLLKSALSITLTKNIPCLYLVKPRSLKIFCDFDWDNQAIFQPQFFKSKLGKSWFNLVWTG